LLHLLQSRVEPLGAVRIRHFLQQQHADMRAREGALELG
jgi:hypothetical protein